MAALAVAMTLAFSGLALARDHDDDHHYRDKHESSHDNWKRGHDNDRGHWHGQDNSVRRDRDHDRWEREHHDSWWHRDRNRDSGYYGGQIYNRIPNRYPGTYGYPGGGYGYPNGGYGYPNGGYGYPNGGYGYPSGGVYGRNGGGRNMGYNMGYQDGSYRARKDISENKPFNPNPRGDFGNRDHGYNSSYGDKNSYRAEYTQGYMAGYQSNYRGGRGWGY
jgi:hypothetical protein